MPFCNKLLAIAAASALFAAPTFADGIPGQKVNRGPSALQAHTMTPPEPGCVLVNGGTQWSCPVPQARFTSTHNTTTHRAAPTRRATTTTRSAPTAVRTTTRRAPTTTTRTASATGYHGSHNHSHGGQAYTGTHTHSHSHGATSTRTVTRSAPTVTRTVTRSAPAPVRRTVSAPVRTVAAPQQMTLDLGAFNGGVGSGVDGGGVYGGGFVSLGSDKSFSGVLQSRAAAFTFQQRTSNRGNRGGKKGGKGGHGGHHGGGGHGGHGGGGCGC